MSSRDKLIAAMSDLMWERGFAATTPREVSEMSGVGRGSMYHHFASKKDMGIAAIEDFCNKLTDRSIAVLTSEGSPLDRLHAYLDMPREPVKGCRIGRLTQDPVVAQDPDLLAPVSASFAATHGALAAVVQEALDEGSLHGPLDAKQWARLISTTIQGSYVLSIASADGSPYDEAITAMHKLIAGDVAGLTGGASPKGKPNGSRKEPH